MTPLVVVLPFPHASLSPLTLPEPLLSPLGAILVGLPTSATSVHVIPVPPLSASSLVFLGPLLSPPVSSLFSRSALSPFPTLSLRLVTLPLLTIDLCLGQTGTNHISNVTNIPPIGPKPPRPYGYYCNVLVIYKGVTLTLFNFCDQAVGAKNLVSQLELLNPGRNFMCGGNFSTLI